MSELTISSFQPQVSWPFPGTTATLRYQYSADFVDSGGQPVLRGLYKDIACTVAAGVLTVPSHTLITTNDAVVNPLATLSARLLDARGTLRVWLFQQFSIPQSLTPTTTIGDLEIYNQGSSLVLPPDAYLTRDEVIALIAARLPNTVLASDVLLGLVRLSYPPVSALDPVALGPNDPTVGDLRGTLTENVVPRATGPKTLADGQIVDDGVDVNIQTLNAFQAGDFEQNQNGSYLDVNDSLDPAGGRADLFAGGDGGAEYAGVAADCSTGHGQIFVQATDYSYLFGESGNVKLGDGLGANNGTMVEIDDVLELIKMTNLPTSDPAVVNALWRDGQQLMISDG